MDKEKQSERLAGVDADIQRLLERAATDRSQGGVVGFGSVLLAAKLLSIRSQPMQEEETDKQV